LRCACIRIMPPNHRFVACWFRELANFFHIR
jgi:hypothetical protein